MMDEEDPIRNDIRRKRRQEKLGDSARCALCGEGEWELLSRVKRRRLEEHHFLAKANDADSTITLCRNCHARATERQRQAGVDFQEPETLLHRIVAILKSVGSFFELLAEVCLRWARELAQFISRLDADVPSWRDVDGR